MNTALGTNMSVVNDINNSPIFTLDDCLSDERVFADTKTGTIRKSQRDEAFVRVGAPLKFRCLVQNNKNEDGGFIGESFHPVTKSLQDRDIKKLRHVAFNPCASISGEKFIFPQKLQSSSTGFDQWLESLAAALDTPCGQWLKVWSNRALKQYEYELVDAKRDGEIE